MGSSVDILLSSINNIEVRSILQVTTETIQEVTEVTTTLVIVSWNVETWISLLSYCTIDYTLYSDVFDTNNIIICQSTEVGGSCDDCFSSIDIIISKSSNWEGTTTTNDITTAYISMSKSRCS